MQLPRITLDRLHKELFWGEEDCSGWSAIETHQQKEIFYKHLVDAKNWNQIMPALLENLTTTLVSTLHDTMSWNYVESEISALKKRLLTLESSLPVIVPIETFAPEPFEVVSLFHIVVQPQEDEFIATFFDANLSASGETKEEAVYNLKDIIIATYNALTRHDKTQLGAALKRQLKVLENFIRKIR